jgi:hypothetical protein
MAKDKTDTAITGDATAQETVTHPDANQAQLRIDDNAAATYYSSTAQIFGSAEEIVIGFSQGIRPTGQANVAMLKIDARVVMSPYAAKRLALALGQTIQRYEQAFGVIEIDPRKRLRQQPDAPAPATTRAN